MTTIALHRAAASALARPIPAGRRCEESSRPYHRQVTTCTSGSGRPTLPFLGRRPPALPPVGCGRALIAPRAKGGEKARDSEGQGSEEDAKPLGEVALEIATSPLTYVTVGALVAYKIVSLNEQTSTVIALASLPFIIVYYIGNYSSLGKSLEAGLKERLPALEAKADAARAEQAAARAASPWYGPGRPTWGDAPHLSGGRADDLAGNYAFDPLGLSADPADLEKNVEWELLHARWAMLAALGALVPEALALNGADILEPVWWKVGAARLAGGPINYLGVEGLRVAGGQGAAVIAICQVVLMGGPEYARYVGIRGLEPLGVFLPGDGNYPGGFVFDPLGLGGDAEALEEQKVKEIKNGRLAMLSVLGLYAQAAVTHKGPLQNALDFASDPAKYNIVGYLSGGAE